MDANTYINRELSWLEFNRRVLEEAKQETVPLLERVKFLAIFSSNLDEFFMVRVARLKRLIRAGDASADPDGWAPAETLSAVSKRVHELAEEQHRCFLDIIMPQLSAEEIHLVRPEEMTGEQERFLQEFPSHPVPDRDTAGDRSGTSVSLPGQALALSGGFSRRPEDVAFAAQRSFHCPHSDPGGAALYRAARARRATWCTAWSATRPIARFVWSCARKPIRRYCHLATGNYNVRTAGIYSDLGLFTCREAFGEDLTELFNLLTGYPRPQKFNHLLLAPLGLREHLLGQIRKETEHARAGRAARIIARVNSLTDPAIIEALYEASRAGVQIDLIVRGIGSLRPGVPEFSGRIRVLSVVDRYLEHARAFFTSKTAVSRSIGSPPPTGCSATSTGGSRLRFQSSSRPCRIG